MTIPPPFCSLSSPPFLPLVQKSKTRKNPLYVAVGLTGVLINTAIDQYIYSLHKGAAKSINQYQYRPHWRQDWALLHITYAGLSVEWAGKIRLCRLLTRLLDKGD